MKRIYSILLAGITLMLLLFVIGFIFRDDSSNNPYEGKYKNSSNTILVLSSNGDCKVIESFYKDVFYTYGRYTVKDNELEISFDKHKDNYLRVQGLKGKVKGSNIEFYNYLDEDKVCVYKRVK